MLVTRRKQISKKTLRKVFLRLEIFLAAAAFLAFARWALSQGPQHPVVISWSQESERPQIVVAIPTDDQRYRLAKASRLARKGLRTVIVTNSTSLNKQEAKEGLHWQENWRYLPDDQPIRANYRGDTRAALVPFLAHEVLGDTFQWLLYGDDDTQWFVEHAGRLVAGLDPSLPYILTDNTWWAPENGTIGSHPHVEAPRCLPCGFTQAGKVADLRLQFNAPEGCPCTPQLLCHADTRNVFDKKCSIPLHLSPVFSSRTYSLHGGAGAIMSIGLLRRVSYKRMTDCIKAHGSSTGGDAYVTICLWKMGFAHTDPGISLNRLGVSAFGGVENYRARDLAKDFAAAALGKCKADDYICQVLVEEIVSFHVSSRHEVSHKKAAEAMLILNDAYAAYLASLQARRILNAVDG